MHRGIFTIGTILIPLGGGGCYVALQIHPDHPGSVSEVAAWVSGAALAASGLTAALLGAMWPSGGRTGAASVMSSAERKRRDQTKDLLGGEVEKLAKAPSTEESINTIGQHAVNLVLAAYGNATGEIVRRPLEFLRRAQWPGVAYYRDWPCLSHHQEYST